MRRPRRPKPAPARSARPDSGLPIWKKGVFALVACMLALLLAEGLLALVGVKVALFEKDPYVGFSRNVPHFVPDPTAPSSGMLVTAENKRRVLNPQRFPAKKPKGTFRIFCMGGSTTYGHPYSDSTSFAGWLRVMLPMADPTRTWEVINCGGISYASYREALLMEELIQYEPDLFIVLSAHNEFLEQRTYGEILAVPESLRGLGALLGRTRLYTAMKDGLGHGGTGLSGTTLATNILPENVEAILDRTVGPQSYHRDEAWQKNVVDHYRFNLARMVDIAASVGARVVFVSPASNLRSCSPFKSEHRAGLTPAELAQWESHVEKAVEAQRARQSAEALKFVEQAIQIDDQFAQLHYLRGHVLWDLDRFPEARAAFVRARDEDVCPLRALSSMLEATAGIARDRRAAFVDFTSFLEARSLHRVPGDDWFLDHVHPTIEGHRQLALELMSSMRQMGVFRPSPSWNEAGEQAARRAVEGRLTERDQATALVTLAKVIAWSGKGDEAYRISRRAAQLAPDDATVQFELGKNAGHAGRLDEAIECLQTAVRLNPAFVEALSLLGTKLAERGRPDEAIRHCRQAVALRPADPMLLLNLGELLRRQKQLPEAITIFQQALQLSPNYAEAHSNLGWALKEQGRFTGALNHFRDAERFRPGATRPMIGLAWILAAHPDASMRNPAEAVRLGERLAELSGHRHWLSLDALAVAYASAGRFEDAVKTAERSLALVQEANPSEVGSVAARLALFRQGRPFIEAGPNAP